VERGCTIPAPRNLYYFKAFLFPNCFLGILVQREIIANASLLVRISPRTACKDTKKFGNKWALSKKMKINGELFGRLTKNAYLCSVRTIVLTTPLSAGSKTLSPLLHLKVTS